MRSYNDDLVMALAIACWVRDTALETSKKDVEYKKAMLDGIFMNSRKMNTAIKGMDGHAQSFEKKYEKELQQTKEFVWIFKG
jgi:hypothetical protein